MRLVSMKIRTDVEAVDRLEKSEARRAPFDLPGSHVRACASVRERTRTRTNTHARTPASDGIYDREGQPNSGALVRENAAQKGRFVSEPGFVAFFVDPKVVTSVVIIAPS